MPLFAFNEFLSKYYFCKESEISVIIYLYQYKNIFISFLRFEKMLMQCIEVKKCPHASTFSKHNYPIFIAFFSIFNVFLLKKFTNLRLLEKITYCNLNIFLDIFFNFEAVRAVLPIKSVFCLIFPYLRNFVI